MPGLARYGEQNDPGFSQKIIYISRLALVHMEKIFSCALYTWNYKPLKGSDLGLAIVKAFVEAQGGGVDAYSAGKNQGSTFSIQLPI